MAHSTQKWLTLVAVLGFAYWFFGNLYEAVVFSPNWVVDSPAQLARLHALFVVTSPTTFFVPVTQAATVLAWVLLALNRDESVKREYRRAGLFAVLATVLNVVIVSTVILKIFSQARSRGLNPHSIAEATVFRTPSNHAAKSSSAPGWAIGG